MDNRLEFIFATLIMSIIIIYGIVSDGPNAKGIAPHQINSELRKIAQTAYSDIYKKIQGKSTVLIPPYRNKGSNFSNERLKKFSDYFTNNMINSDKFRVVSRQKMNDALKELNLQLNDIFDKKKSVQIGKFLGAEKIITMEGIVEFSRKTGSLPYELAYSLKSILGLNETEKGFLFPDITMQCLDIKTTEIDWGWNNQ